MASNNDRPPRISQPASGQDADNSIVISDDEGQPRPPVSRHGTKPKNYVDLTEDSEDIQMLDVRPVTKPNPTITADQIEPLVDRIGNVVTIVNETRVSLPDPVLRSSESSSTGNQTAGVARIDDNHRPVLDPSHELAFDTEDFDVCQAQVELNLKKHLTTLHELHALDVKQGLKRERLCFARETRFKKLSGKLPSTYVPTIPTQYLQTKSPFADMPSIQITHSDLSSTPNGRGLLVFSQIIENRSTNQKGPLTITHLSVPVESFRSQAVQVPSYREYVHFRDNVVTENDRILHSEPWFDDNTDIKKHKEDLWEEVNRLYDLINHNKPERVLINEQCRVFKPYVEALLTDLGITWDDILYWLLADDETIKKINTIPNSMDTSRFGSKLLQRSSFYKSKTRERPKWKEIFQHLTKPSCRNLRLSAMLSSTLKKFSDFSIWNLLRESPTVLNQMAAKLRPLDSTIKPTETFQYRSRVCLLCQEHDCLFHGEVTERARITEVTDDEHNRSDSEDDSEANSEIDKLINYRRTVTSAGQQRQSNTAANISEARWEPPKKANLIYQRAPFYPCVHEGTCHEARCRCYRENIVCERACACPSSCNRRFRGCSCATKRRGQPCETGSTTCECIAMNRECDAELCGACGAADILDPVNRYEEKVNRLCANVAIQRNVATKTYLGHSSVHGFGLYTGEPLGVDQLIGEYKGEVVTVEEADRRGAIYKHKMTNYLFDLNRRQETDSARAGNKLRFINHASDEHCNCYPRIVLCNGVARIGLYASKRIKVGTELFFNYHYDEEQMANFLEPAAAPPKKGSAFAAKTKMTKASFAEKESTISRRRAQTEVARLARLSKVSKSKDPQSTTAAPSGRPSGMRATKSVISKPSTHHRTGSKASSGMVNKNSSRLSIKRHDVDTSFISNFGVEIPGSDNEDADYEESASDGEDRLKDFDIPNSEEEDDYEEKRGRALRPRLNFGVRAARETRKNARPANKIGDASTVGGARATPSSATALSETKKAPAAAPGQSGQPRLINPNKAARKSVQMRPRGDTGAGALERKRYVISDDEDESMDE